MPQTPGRYMVQIGNVLLEAESFEWNRSFWDPLIIRLSEQSGWKTLTDTAKVALISSYNGAHGSVLDGPTGLLVQYVGGTGSPAFQCYDWRGNVGDYVWSPDDGLVLEEIATDEGGGGGGPYGAIQGYSKATLKLIQVS
ncbi:MAG: hypothetical protein ACREEC_12670 [Thermoplasmata archaeon]